MGHYLRLLDAGVEVEAPARRIGDKSDLSDQSQSPCRVRSLLSLMSHDRADLIARYSSGTRLNTASADLKADAANLAVYTAPSLPLDLIAGLARLRTLPVPAGFPAERWLNVVTGALAFAREWAAVALTLGWTPLDLFGLHPVAPAARHDARGLALSLERGARVFAITADAATVRTPVGNPLRFYRPHDNAGAVLAWELANEVTR